MPAFSCHYMFAKELMPYIKDTADFNVNEAAVFFGTQGPDIFFFHRIFPWMPGKSLRKTGSALHRAKPSDIFESMRTYCEQSGRKDIAQSYIYGFILHYALDRTCHPYVYSVQNEITKRHRFTNPHTAHNIVEFSMDSYLLNKRLGIENPAKFDTAETLSSNNDVISEIGKLLSYSVTKITGTKITCTQAETALRDTKYVQKICLDKYAVKRAFLSVAETVAAPFSKNYKFTAMLRPGDLEKAKKYANIEKKMWQSPYCKGKRYESFEELFETAKKDAERMIVSFQSGENCKTFTDNLSFLTGVETE